jgi:hypothetical protein
MATPGYAAQITGNDLYKWLTDSDDRLMGIAYMRGFIDAQLTGFPLTGHIFGKDMEITVICVPANATGDQAIDIVRRSLATKPETRHLAAPSLIRTAFFDAGWGCKG